MSSMANGITASSRIALGAVLEVFNLLLLAYLAPERRRLRGRHATERSGWRGGRVGAPRSVS